MAAEVGEAERVRKLQSTIYQESQKESMMVNDTQWIVHG